MILRDVTQQDIRRIHEWRNDPVTQEMSGSTEEITLADHAKWFAARLTENDIWIGVDQESDIGVVAGKLLLWRQEAPTISITVAPPHRGKGFAVSLIEAGTQRLMEKYCSDTVMADVKAANTPSLKAFLRAGYVIERVTDDRRWLEMRYERPAHRPR